MTPLAPAFIDRPLAHRGYHDLSQGRPENSEAAGLAALSERYGIEIDVQLSADGEAMVFHDYDLDRLTGETGPVRDRSSEKLSKIALTGGGPQTVPRLRDFLALIGGRTPVVIEIKDQSGNLGPTDGVLERAVAEVLADVAHPGAYAVMSFNPHAVAEFVKHAPGIARGLVTDAFRPEVWTGVPTDRLDHLRGIAAYEQVGASFISHNVTDLASPHVARLKEKGAAILCWTVRSAAVEAEARKVVDNITFEGYAPAKQGG